MEGLTLTFIFIYSLKLLLCLFGIFCVVLLSVVSLSVVVCFVCFRVLLFCFCFCFLFLCFFCFVLFFCFFLFFFWGGGRLCTVNVTDIKVINVIKQFQSEILNHLPLAFFELSGNF